MFDFLTYRRMETIAIVLDWSGQPQRLHDITLGTRLGASGRRTYVPFVVPQVLLDKYDRGEMSGQITVLLTLAADQLRPRSGLRRGKRSLEPVLANQLKCQA